MGVVVHLWRVSTALDTLVAALLSNVMIRRGSGFSKTRAARFRNFAGSHGIKRLASSAISSFFPMMHERDTSLSNDKPAALKNSI